MIRGLSFEIPNEYGSFLANILKPLNTMSLDWYIGGEESYYANNGTLGEFLFSEEAYGMDGKIFNNIIENNMYYLIFVKLKAFPKGKAVKDIRTYKEFLDSDCLFVLYR